MNIKIRHKRWYQARSEVRKRQAEQHKASRKRVRIFKQQTLSVEKIKRIELRRPRNDLTQKLYHRKVYEGTRLEVKIDGNLGIEEQSGADAFLNKASEFIDFESAEIFFNLQKCSMMWPSAITLLCSLMRWVELTRMDARHPLLSSGPSDDNRVNSYLSQSGFYDYVHRAKDSHEKYCPDDQIVKIRRETIPSSVAIESREEEIMKLLRTFAGMGAEDLERFDAKVLTEVFNNITEHGVNLEDQGWWVAGQFHPTHKIISLCFADNGIGIRHSLMTGPQRDEIGNRLENLPQNDGEFIRMALEQTVSGALEAPVRDTGFSKKKFVPGASRGHGLKIIKNTCAQLGIAFSILSHHGFVCVDREGGIVKFGANDARIFAGTLYHFTITTN